MPMSAHNGSQSFGRPQQPGQNQWGQQPSQSPGGYPAQGPAQQGYGNPAPSRGPAPQQPPYGGQQGYGDYNAQPGYGSNYAPQFEPYAPPAPQPSHPQAAQAQHYPQHGYGHAPAPRGPAQPSQWGAPQTPQGYDAGDGRGFDLGSYMPATQPGAEPGPSLPDWAAQGYQPGYQDGYPQPHTPHGYQNDLGSYEPAMSDLPPQQQNFGAPENFAPANGGDLDQGYSEDEQEYEEAETAPRSRRPIFMAAVLAGAIAIGGGGTYAYKNFVGRAGGDPPVVKSATAPVKVKPEDGGGKQFAHTDSKIMGRLGDGSVAAGGADAAPGDDGSGTRKVSTLIVGRDGSIQAPAAAPAEGTSNVGVPGMTVVDGLGPARAPAAAATIASAQGAPPQASAPTKISVTPPAAASAPAKPVTIAKVAQADATGSLSDTTAEADPVADAPAAAPAKPKKKVAAAAPASTSVATTGSGFVAVLASVPRSDSSRMDALKRFADMQQKYGSVLSGKTPDVAEANLGAKGSYHRLVVGPPGSREQASAVCSQLKSQGYADCWVTSY